MKFEFQFMNEEGNYVSCTSRNMKVLTRLLKPQDNGESDIVNMRIILKEIPEGMYVDSVGLYLNSSSSYGEYENIQTQDDPNESLNSLRSFESDDEGLFVIDSSNVKTKFTNTVGTNGASKIEIITDATLREDNSVDFSLQFSQSNGASNTRFYVGLEAEGRLLADGEASP